MLRAKERLSSPLDAIDASVWPNAKLSYATLGAYSACVRAAAPEELSQVAGITPTLAQIIQQHLRRIRDDHVSPSILASSFAKHGPPARRLGSAIVTHPDRNLLSGQSRRCGLGVRCSVPLLAEWISAVNRSRLDPRRATPCRLYRPAMYRFSCRQPVNAANGQA